MKGNLGEGGREGGRWRGANISTYTQIKEEREGRDRCRETGRKKPDKESLRSFEWDLNLS